MENTTEKEIVMTESELAEVIKNAELKAENAIIKKNIPFMTTNENTEKQVQKGEVGHAIALGLAASIYQTTPELMEKRWKDERQSRFTKGLNTDNVVKNMNIGTYSAGGFMLVPQYAEEFIPVLKEKSVVRAAGAEVKNLVGNQLIYRTEGTGSTAYWVGEAGALTKSELAGGMIELKASKLGAQVVLSNELLRFASPDIESQIEKDLLSEMALKEDAAFLRGDGTGNTPPSFKTLIHADNKFDMTATPTYITVEKDLTNAIYLMRTANIPMTKPSWFFSPRTESFLFTLRDADGHAMYRDEMLSRHTILGIPYKVTSQIPDNLEYKTVTNCSEIFLVDMDQVLIGQSYDTQIEFFRNGAYGTGESLVSGITTDESVVRALMMTTLGLKYAKAGAIINGVIWGKK